MDLNPADNTDNPGKDKKDTKLNNGIKYNKVLTKLDSKKNESKVEKSRGSFYGRRFFAFVGEAYREAKKVVWPSRKETWQTTVIVFIFVFVVALFLWLVDKIAEWSIFSLILGWK